MIRLTTYLTKVLNAGLLLIVFFIKWHLETCCLTPLLLSTQLFSSEEKRASQQHRITVYGAPGPEPFTVICVTEQTTAKQLLDMVSTQEIKIYDT